MSETVLVIGATGNIGVAAVHGALKAGRKVLAIVRNQASAEKLFKAVGTKENITTVEGDVTAEDGVQKVVDKVRQGQLPAFQHVWASVGGAYGGTLLQDMTVQELREHMHLNFETNFFAYRATIPYLLKEQKDTITSFSLCTGAQGDVGQRPPPALSQGALFSLANAGAYHNRETNVRVVEVYLGYRVEVDEEAVKHGVQKSSEFGEVYRQVLERKDLKGCRLKVIKPEDCKELKVETIPKNVWG